MYKNLKSNFPLFFLLIFIVSAHAQTTLKKSSNTTQIESAILDEVNIYRKKNHLSPLAMNSYISQQARNHSNNMAKHAVTFGHKNFFKRVEALRKEVKNTGGAAENVAYNYKDAHEVVKNWMLSPGHKRNILGNYDLTGVGVVRDSHGKLHFTQMFVKTGVVSKTRSTGYVPRNHFPSFSLGSIFKRSAT